MDSETDDSVGTPVTASLNVTVNVSPASILPAVVPLFTELTVEDTTAIVKDLERQGIAYELKNEGATVLVARDRVARVRMKLAEGGLPKGGGIGYEIFDKSDTLGATSFVQNINHLRALEGELARSIRTFDRMKDKVTRDEAVSQAKSELAGDNLDDRFAQLERDDEVDRALAELKARRSAPA